ncbi:MAG: STAS domain-containing protein [Nocardioides sp.]
MTPSETLTIGVERCGDTVVVRCAGELDLATVGTLREQLVETQIYGPTRLIVVLDEVVFLDSLGLGALIGAHKRARVLQGELVVVCTSPPVLRVFTATALDHVLRIVDTLDEALAPR